MPWSTCCGESAQDAAGDFMLSGGKGEAGQGNHGVAAPIAEPVIAGDDGLLVAPGDDVLVAGSSKSLGKLVLYRRGTVAQSGGA